MIRPAVVTANPAAATAAARHGGRALTAEPARTVSARDTATPGWSVRYPMSAARTAAAVTVRPTAAATSRPRSRSSAATHTTAPTPQSSNQPRLSSPARR